MSPGAGSKKRKRGSVSAASSSAVSAGSVVVVEEEDQQDRESNSEGDDEEESNDGLDDDADCIEISSDDDDGSEYADHEDDAYSSEEEDEEEEDDGSDDDREDYDSIDGNSSEEKLYNKVVNLLHGQRSLEKLKLKDCKAYLRKHNLRLSGNRATCIERVLEHWRIKDGNGYKLYPRSSFSINCTGDACKGDVILFRQKVYDKFNKVKRGGNIIGKRIIAGRIIKDSYGSAKQQHTFTVEVLWSRGVKSLPFLFPLNIKGRNLYKLQTFRQRWKNEEERSKILAEKHNRGAAARHARDIRKANHSNKALMCQRSYSSSKTSNKKKKQDTKDYGKQRRHDVCIDKAHTRANKQVEQVLGNRRKKEPEHDIRQFRHNNFDVKGESSRHLKPNQATGRNTGSPERGDARQARYTAHNIHMQSTSSQRNPIHSYCNTLPIFHQNNYMAPHAKHYDYYLPTNHMGYAHAPRGYLPHPATDPRQIVGHHHGGFSSHYAEYRGSALQRPPEVFHSQILPPGNYPGWRRP